MKTITLPTATPWTVEIESEMDGDIELGYQITIPEINRMFFDTEWADPDEWETSKANTEFIVQACNNYIRLVEALNEIYIAWHNRDETTSLAVWNERMKAAMAEVTMAFELAGIPVKTKP